jgi:hypothetical protein
MNGAPFGKLLVLPALLFAGACVAIGVVLGTLISKPAPAVPPDRQCIVIDLRTKPGPGKIVPAEPGI